MMKKRYLTLMFVLPILSLLLASCDNINGLPMESLRGDDIPKESWHDAIGSARLGGGSGDSADDPIEISTPEQFALFSKNVCDGESYEGKYIALTNDIDLSGKRWVTIGKIKLGMIKDGEFYNSEEQPFKGIFDGGNHVISDTIVFHKGGKGNWDFIGLFHTNEGIIKNLHLTNAHIETSSDVPVGGLVGDNNGKILNCSVSGYVQGADAGGLVGSNFGAIVNCSANVTVIGIQKRSATEYSDHGLGGFVGVNRGEIENCFVKGKIGASGKIKRMGGFVGSSKMAHYGPTEASQKGTFIAVSFIKNCYSSMEFYSDSSDLRKGTFAGAALNPPYLIVENCYYEEDIVDRLPGTDIDFPVEMVAPLHTEEMKAESFVKLLNRDNEEGPWLPDVEMENEGYPVLDKNYEIDADGLFASDSAVPNDLSEILAP